MKRMPFFLIMFFLASTLLIIGLSSAASCADIPEKGATLPAFELSVPTVQSDAAYLGVNGQRFQLKDVGSETVIVEIIGVYCSRCFQQAPLFNNLFLRINRKAMGDKVKMLGIAAGGTQNEVEYLRMNGTYEFPVVTDESFEVHKLLGEPRTPFTMLVTKDGKVLFTHLGIIDDMDTFFAEIQELIK